MVDIVDTSNRASETFGMLRRIKTATIVIIMLAMEMSMLLLEDMHLLEPITIL